MIPIEGVLITSPSVLTALIAMLGQQRAHLAREEAAGTVAAHRRATIRRLEAQIAEGQAGLPIPGPAPLIPLPPTISSSAELTAALAASRGGEVHVLAPGHYGAHQFRRRRFAVPVTITVSEPDTVRFSGLELRECEGLILQGLTVGWAIEIGYTSRRITVTDNRMAQLHARDTRNLLVEGNTIQGGMTGLRLRSCADFILRGNQIGGHTADAGEISGDTSGLIEENEFSDHLPRASSHIDLIQMFGADGVTPHDITIRRNLLWDDARTGGGSPQAIFCTDPAPDGYRNILIEENVFSAPHTQVVCFAGARTGCLVRRNTIIGAEDAKLGAVAGGIRTMIKAGQGNPGLTIQDNICTGISNESRDASVGGNAAYRGRPLAAVFAGRARSWETIRQAIPLPAAGIPDAMGATAWLRTL